VDLCRNSGIPIVVFNLNKSGGMRAVVEGKKLGTVIGSRQ
ncbi:MAG: UMP kinase, partial [Planctomycetes bacterium]|nr:UMP kinase [Planctomycetota bacterium]